MDSSELMHNLAAVLGTERVRIAHGNEAGVAATVVEPENAEQISELVHKCETDGITFAPMGASRTLAQIRSAPVRIGVSLTRMNRIVNYEPDDMTAVAEAGLTLEELNSVAAGRGQRLPCDPAKPELTTLGALVGAAKAGPLRLSEGGPRDLLIGVRFVGHGGRLIHGGGRVVKNVAGYDLMKVLTGSFGTLGIITETTFKLRPFPQNYTLAMASFDSAAEALTAASRAEAAASLIHLEVVSQSLGERFGRTGRSVVLAGFGGSRTEADHYRAFISNALRRNTQMLTANDALAGYASLRDIDFDHAPVVAELAVLPSELPQSLAACNAEFRAHAASGIAQLFLCGGRSEKEIHGAVSRWRDVARAARGYVRVLRVLDHARGGLEMFDQPNEAALGLMRRLKRTFDPHNVFNPGCFVGGI